MSLDGSTEREFTESYSNNHIHVFEIHCLWFDLRLGELNLTPPLEQVVLGLLRCGKMGHDRDHGITLLSTCVNDKFASL